MLRRVFLDRANALVMRRAGAAPQPASAMLVASARAISTTLPFLQRGDFRGARDDGYGGRGTPHRGGGGGGGGDWSGRGGGEGDFRQGGDNRRSGSDYGGNARSGEVHQRSGDRSSSDLTSARQPSPPSSPPAKAVTRQPHVVIEGELTTQKAASALNQLKRAYKNSREYREHKSLIREARQLLSQVQVAADETDEKSVALVLNAAAFFAILPNTPVVTQCCAWFKENLGGCEAQHVALFAHGVAALKIPNAKSVLEQQVSPRAMAVLPTMMPVEMAMILQAFARVGASDDKLFRAIVARSTEVMATIKAGELSTMCSAIALLGLHRSAAHQETMPIFLGKMVAAVSTAAGSLNSATLAELLKAMAEFGLDAKSNVPGCGDLLKKMCDRGSGIGYQSTEIPTMYEALVRLHCTDHESIWPKLDERLSVCAKFIAAPDVARIAAACQQLPRKFVPKSLSELFAPNLLGKNLHRAKIPQVADLVAEMALLNFRFDPLYITAMQRAAQCQAAVPAAGGEDDGGDPLANQQQTAAGDAPPASQHYLPQLVQIYLACRTMLSGTTQQAELDLAALSAQVINAATAAPIEEVVAAFVVLFSWTRRAANLVVEPRHKPKDDGSLPKIGHELLGRIIGEGMGTVNAELRNLLRASVSGAGQPPFKIGEVTWMSEAELRKLKL